LKSARVAVEFLQYRYEGPGSRRQMYALAAKKLVVPSHYDT
jgi:hypothetical protein